MKIHSETQGTPEWHALRGKFDTASEAPAMMGASKQMKRNELLHAKKTGLTADVNWWVQKNLFDKGHDTEAKARPIIEKLIGEELYPIVGSENGLLASMDGATMMGETLFEHKLWNEELAAAVRAKNLDPHYYWQMEQQLLVSGAQRVIFVTSDGTEENLEWMEYRPVEGRAEKLVAGWKQFNIDLADFVPTEAKVEAVANVITDLPSLSVLLVGEVKQSNLVVYKQTALAFIENINTDLKTDQHFADAEATVKFCERAEKELELVKSQALAQTASIDELFRTVDSLKESMRSKRLMLEKLVKARKEAIKVEIKLEADDAFRDHIATINKRLGKVQLPVVIPDFASVMKNKRTVASLRDAVDTELARLKIDANEVAERIETNLSSLRELAKDHGFLFMDAQQIVMKDNDDLVNLISLRISEHKAAEEKKQEELRETIRAEEAEKLRLENERKAKLEEAEKLAAAQASAPAAEPVAATDQAETQVDSAPAIQEPEPAATVAPTPAASAATKAAVATYKATVTDLMALAKAVVTGDLPLALLQVNQEELDKMVASNDGRFACPGVTLSKA